MAGFKKFDPYAWLERERQKQDGKLTPKALAGSAALAGVPLKISNQEAAAENEKRTFTPYPIPTIQNEKYEGTPAKPANAAKPEGYSRTSSLNEALAALERRCPDYIDPKRWRQAVEDGRAFLLDWKDQVVAFEWTAEDLFGLHEPPSNPHPSYSRLSRYDCTGLIWLLGGDPVVAMTETTAAIQHRSGSVTIYRKDNKPGLGPLGDSLDDFI
jgi:hypothetical protein